MKKLKLTDEEIIIFKNALSDAYMAGKGDAFMSAGARLANENKNDALGTVFNNYCESEDEK